jgi:hypothetical protein
MNPPSRILPTLGALALLAGLLAAAWQARLLDPTPRVDEGTYLHAFALWQADQSPYQDAAFLYPPPFAQAGAWLLDGVGELRTLFILRALNAFGLLAAVWLASAYWGMPWLHRLALAALIVVQAPAVNLAFGQGNLSFLTLGSIFAALALWPANTSLAPLRGVPANTSLAPLWRPLGAGVLLGLSMLVKPLAPGLLAVLATHGALDAWRARRLWPGFFVAISASLVWVAAWAFTPHWPDFLALAGAAEPNTRTLSMRRLIGSLGFGTPSVLWVALLALTFLLWLGARRHPGERPTDTFDMLGLGIVTAVWTTPMLWIHSLFITLPLQGVAAVLAVSRWRQGPEPGEAPRRRVYELLLVALAIVALHAADGVDGVTTQATWLQPVAYGVPLIAPLGLHLYQRHYRRSANIAR